MMKTLERVVLWHMLETTLPIKPMSDKQHGFCKPIPVSCACMAEHIKHTLVNKRFTLGVFLDIQGAPKSIVRGLREKHADITTVKCYEPYLMNCSMEAEVKGGKVSWRLIRGTPQGGVLSPIMWNLVFDSLFACYGEDSPFKCINTGLIVEGENQHFQFHHMNNAIERALR
jgi:hypothetical protein